MSEALYQEAIKALARADHGHGTLAAADGEARLDNPLCGDRVRIGVKLESGTLTALAHEVKGCLLCRAAASAIGLHATGKSAAELAHAMQALARMLEDEAAPAPEGWPELSAFTPARAHRSRHGCVLLPFEALAAALDAARVRGRA